MKPPEPRQPDDRPPASRRDFLARLTPRSASPPTSSPDSKPREAAFPAGHEADRLAAEYLQTFTHSAMACQFEFLFNLGQYPRCGESAMAGIALIDEIEDRFSIYRPHSELSRLNATAAEEPRPASPALWNLLRRAQELSRETGGAFDVTCTPLTRLWGFYSRQPVVPESSQIDAVLPHIGYDLIKLFETERQIQFLDPSVEINLHGIGKGYAVDQVVDLFERDGIFHFAIHAGQSSVCARGDCHSSTAGTGAGWKIGLTHPVFPARRIGEITLRNKSLGTSGTARQAIVQRGRRFGHVVDPRTGWPPDHTLSSTVIHPETATCDALATAFFVMSLEEVQAYCDTHQDLGTVLICRRPRGDQFDIHTFNMADEELVWQA